MLEPLGNQTRITLHKRAPKMSLKVVSFLFSMLELFVVAIQSMIKWIISYMNDLDYLGLKFFNYLSIDNKKEDIGDLKDLILVYIFTLFLIPYIPATLIISTIYLTVILNKYSKIKR